MATDVVVVERSSRKHRWPEAQLNFWLLIMFGAAGTLLGVFATFIAIQQQMGLGIPWLFPFEVTISALGIVYLIMMLVLIARRSLLPGIVLVGTFILFVLWLAGLIQTSVMMFGPSGGVNSNCNIYVFGSPVSGVSVYSLAYLQQKNICQSWQAAFAFEIVGTVFLFWMMVMSWQVNRDVD